MRLSRFLLAAAISTAWATAGAQSSAIVLQLPSSARAAALGNAYSGASEDDAVIFYNPAQLAVSTRAWSAGFSVQRYVEASNVAAVSAGTRLRLGRIAVGVQVLDFGTEPELVPDPDFGGERGRETGERVGARDVVASAGYGIQLSRLRAGATVKLVNQQVADLGASTHALDVGAAITSRIGVLGAVMQNSGGLMRLGNTTAALPLSYRGGIAVVPLKLGRSRIATLAEVSRVRDGGVSWAGGAEITVLTSRGLTLAGRVGVRALQFGSSGSRVTLGGGLQSSELALDYSVQTIEGIEVATHRLGVRWWKD